MARADTLTITSKQVNFFSDILINMDKNPITGLLARAVNEEAIKQSLRNIILTKPTERFYNPRLGSKLRASLFDPVTRVTEETIKFSITAAMQYERRAKLVKLDIKVNNDLNEYNVGIYFESINFPGQVFFANVLVRNLR